MNAVLMTNSVSFVEPFMGPDGTLTPSWWMFTALTPLQGKAWGYGLATLSLVTVYHFVCSKSSQEQTLATIVRLLCPGCIEIPHVDSCRKNLGLK